MINISIMERNTIKIYNCGVLIIEAHSYNDVVLIINKLKNVIQDVYQLNVLEEIIKNLRQVR